MGKYSDEERRPRDFYPTPKKAVIPLLKWIKRLREETGEHQTLNFGEPCAGDGRLITHLAFDGGQLTGLRCNYASDIKPLINAMGNQGEEGYLVVKKHSATDKEQMLKIANERNIDMWITNPPWKNDRPSGYLLNSIITSLSYSRPTWLLMDGNFMFNQRSAPYMALCSDVIPVGRVKWIEDSPYSGKENVAWYRFDARNTETTRFHAREK